MKRCDNQFCLKFLELLPGQKRLNPKRRFCNQSCRAKENALKDYFKKKSDPEWIKKKNENTRKWYQKNKEIHKKNILKDYFKNKDKWRERGFVYQHKINIWKILGRICNKCGGEANEVNHLKYDFEPRSKRKSNKEFEKYLIMYCKFLEPLCMPCHRGKKKGKYKPKN